MSKALTHGLYAITDAELIPADHLLATVEQALLGGVRLLQYRNKRDSWQQRRQQAGALDELCRAHAVPLLINDDVALAAEVGAAGVHLGKDDMEPAAARQRLGARAIIGISCYNRLDLALAAARAGADYVAFGSFFPSLIKPDAVRADPDLLRQAKAILSLPIVAVGGITPANGKLLLEAGADYLAVISGVFGQPDSLAAAQSYARLFKVRG
ncbi:MAG TPA: thiamine phosphate synthase [Candidatus Competibacteraceae bacterium]|nr:thiamine phosphate synthase [Candidatus Competibacteraceae bacterium]